MDESQFMRVRLHGGRFKEAELPFFILGDLAPLQEMVVDVAKWLFKKEQKRERASSDFNQIYLKVVGLNSGSCVADIAIDTTQPILPDVPVQNHKYFEMAVGRIVDVIEQAEQGPKRLNGRVPPQYMAYFNRVGRSLLPDERMELTCRKNTANLTQKARAVLVRHYSNEIIRDMTVRGTVIAMHQKNMTFRLQQTYGTQINCTFLEQYRDVIVKALASYKKGKDRDAIRVQVSGTGVYDKSDRLQRVDFIRNVEQLDIRDVDVSLDEFRNLRDGWLDGDGVAPRHSNLDWLSSVFGRYYPGDLPLPHTYPTVNGGVSLEWSFDGREAHIEIDLERCTGEWFVINMKTGKSEEEEDMNLDDPKNWLQIADRLRRLKEKTE